MAFTKTWAEDEPGKDDDLVQGDDEIRDTRFALRERLAVDHNHKADETGDDYIGWHKKCSLLEQADLGTGAVVSGVGHPILGAQTRDGKAELTFTDEDDTDVPLTEGGVAYASFRDRGDPAAADYTLTDFTTDGTWRDLDLSGIVPAGAKAVLLYIRIKDDLTDRVFGLRKNGNSNAFNTYALNTQVANLSVYDEATVACDSNRIIEYNFTNTTWTSVDVTVRGWWKG